MRSKLLSLASLLLITTGSEAQVMFQKTYGYGFAGGDYGRSVMETSDNGFIIAGSSWSVGSGGNNFYLIKTDNEGDTLWTKTFGGAGWEEAFAVRQTSDNGYIVAGITASFGIASSDDGYLVRTDENGDTLWTRNYGGESGEVFWSVDQNTDGGFIMGGQTRSFGAGGWDFYLVRTDEDGDTLWTRAYGGIGDDEGSSVQQTADGGFILCGTTRSFGSGISDIYLVKTDEDGDTLWTKALGQSLYDNGYSVRQTSDNGYIIAGYSMSGNGGMGDICLLKTNVNGDPEWTKTFGKNGDDYGWYAWETAGGGYFISGSLNMTVNGPSLAYLVRTDADGDSLWTRAYNATGATSNGSGTVTSDGGFIIATHSTADGSLYLVKTDANGNSGCPENMLQVSAASPALVANSTATLTGLTHTTVGLPHTLVGGGGDVTSLCSPVGLDEGKSEELSVYPNPAYNTLNISLKDQEAHLSKLKIFNVLGAEILSMKSEGNSELMVLDISGLEEGIYFVHMVTDQQKTFMRKIIIAEHVK